MALIKCPECNNKISDQADTCPKCGYELKKKSSISTSKNGKDYKIYWIIGLIIGACLLFYMVDKNNNNNNNNSNNNNNQNQNQNTNSPTETPNTNPSQDPNVGPSTNEGYSAYTNSTLGIAFEYPNGYKVATDSQGYVYVAKNIDSEGALIPYIMIGRYNDFSNAQIFLNNFTDYMKKNYSDLTVTSNLLSGVIGDKLVYGITYNYISSGHLIVDNRYATVIGGRVYMIATREENVNSTEINSVTEHIISTLLEGGA